MNDSLHHTHPVILFDGVCNLCNSAVQFIIANDPKHYFRFASLQSRFGRQVIEKADLSPDKIVSWILIEEGKVYTRSTAALRICKRLSAFWFVFYGLIIIPRAARDAVYNCVARNRYNLFGKKESCWLPAAELKSLFLD